MRRFAYRWARCLCISLAWLAASLQSHQLAGEQTQGARRVLILYEAGIQWPAIALINDALGKSLQGTTYRIEIYREYMETELLPDEVDQKQLRDFYLRKYQFHRPDVIITVGSSPLRFIAKERGKHFAGIPVIFCLSNGLDDDFKHEPGFTGVTMGIDAATTLKAALHLVPGTKHVFVIGGGSDAHDRLLVQKVKQQLEDYNQRLDITYVTDFVFSELLKRLNRLPPASIVLFTTFGRDAHGRNYTSRESGPLFSSAANAPVFSLFDSFFGDGEVGGSLARTRAQGTIAGGLAVKILDGVSPDDIPVVRAPNEFVFDWRALKRWGLKESNLPPGSTVLYRQPTAWESYKWYIIGGIFLILLEALLIGGMLWHRARLRKAEAGLAITNERLRLSVEAGRSVGWDWDIRSDRDRWFGDLETVFGIPVDSASGPGEEFRRKVHPEDGERILKAVADARENRKPFVAEFRVIRTDRIVRWISARGKFYYGRYGEAERMLGMAVDITDRKQVEEDLASLSGRLIGAQEEERKRIAREIHDDYSQQLALLAMDLENLDEEIEDPSAHQKLRQIWNGIGEVGADLHSLSHRLHSSSLDTLGLVAAAKAFCTEFAEQQEIRVGFADDNVPRDVPGDAALCLFRIVQEGLRNIKRHSGADSAEVRLECSGEKLHLSVTDRGRGFDVNNRSPQSGIGISSMQERLRLLGGQLSISSHPVDGTRIDAWVHIRTPGKSAV